VAAQGPQAPAGHWDPRNGNQRRRHRRRFNGQTRATRPNDEVRFTERGVCLDVVQLGLCVHTVWPWIVFVSVRSHVVVGVCVCWCDDLHGVDAPVKSSNTGSFRMGDDAVSYETEAKGRFAAPVGGGRAALSKPDHGGSISFGSHTVDFTTSASDAFVNGQIARPSGRVDPRVSGDAAAPAGKQMQLTSVTDESAVLIDCFE
jgi:hypothetical protein